MGEGLQLESIRRARAMLEVQLEKSQGARVVAANSK
jgi:hypothetical protein